eukprot:scaffold72771_cov57-Phaeocystis_antarctica.AAC.2
MYVPGSQEEQLRGPTLMPSAAYVPEVHSLHRAEPEPKDLASPGAHLEHTPEKLAPSALASPAWQTMAAESCSDVPSDAADPSSATWCTPTGSGAETPWMSRCDQSSGRMIESRP